MKNGILSFNTEEIFEDVVNRLHEIESLDKWEEEIGFESFRSSLKLEDLITEYETKNQEYPLSDLPLATVLNPNGVVAIENWFFKFDISNQLVYVLENKNESEMVEFVTDGVTENSWYYTFDDDIWGSLKEELPSDEIVTKKKCKEECASTKEKKYKGVSWWQYRTYTDQTTDKTYTFLVKLKIRYDNWGLYRKLYTHFGHKEKFGGASDQTLANIGYQYSYKVKCKDEDALNVTHNIPMQPGNPLSPTTYEYTTSSKDIEHYKGTRCLTTFSLESWASYRDRYSYGLNPIYKSQVGKITN